MGMNRFFLIHIETKDRQPVFDVDLARKIKEAIDAKYSGWTGYLDTGGYIEIDEASWYREDDDMQAVAAEFPDIIFHVQCMGDFMDDMWECSYFRDRVSYREASIPPCDYDTLLRGI